MINFELKYKSALCTATTAYACAKEKNNKEIVQFLELIFPELKESEDERIREYILNFIVLNKGANLPPDDADRMIAWLEKQGEQKITRPVWKYKKDNTPLLRDSFILNKYGCVANSPSGALVSDVWVLDFDELAKLPKEDFERENEQKLIDKIEPKFKVGDFIVHNNNGYVYQVTEIKDDKYCIWPPYAEAEGYLRFIDVDNDYHLWTNKDAKDGDVLYRKSLLTGIEYIVMCRGIDVYGNVDSYFRYNTADGFGINVPSVFNIKEDNTTPATKEQRDLLFQKMEEAGYKWNVVEKKLVKLP